MLVPRNKVIISINRRLYVSGRVNHGIIYTCAYDWRLEQRFQMIKPQFGRSCYREMNCSYAAAEKSRRKLKPSQKFTTARQAPAYLRNMGRRFMETK